LRLRAWLRFVSGVSRSLPLRQRTRTAWLGLIAGAVLALGCAPRARPLAGAPTSAALPAAQLRPGYQRVTFRWEFSDGDVGFKGEGVARVAAPDSARLDFFVNNGLGGGYAVLIGDRLIVPKGAEQIRRVLPPVPLLWAALGRLALPPAPDTTIRSEGRLLRADVGTSPRWRVTFEGTRLADLTRIDDGRVAERVSRGADGEVQYEHLTAHRTLSLTNLASAPAAGFDAAIWRP
jgi:hypothetical protein